MIDEIFPGLYRMEIPLPKNPLKSLNSYVIKTSHRNLMIDTGMNEMECRSAVHSNLEQIGVDLTDTDFFVTHLHADHSGLLSTLATSSSQVFCSQPDALCINTGIDWGLIRNNLSLNGFAEGEIQAAIERHPGYKMKANESVNFTTVQENDTIRVGEYVFTCIETPGHTEGHLCLYEAAYKILVAGDHILNDITPNISLWEGEKNPLGKYLNSLDKISAYDVSLVLPGHRRVFRNFKKRISELKSHHQARNNEILTILGKGSQDAFQIASQMTWDMTYKSWELFPPSQKYFATGEANAHLRYLREDGLIEEELRDGRILFSLEQA